MSNNKRRISFFKKMKIKIIKINRLDNKTDINNLFKKIFQIGKGRILIETGLTFLNLLLKYKLINNLYLFKSNISLKKNGYNHNNISLIKKLKLVNKIKVNLFNDELFKLRVK